MYLWNKNNPTCRASLRITFIVYERGASRDTSQKIKGNFGNSCGAVEIYKMQR